MISIGLVGATGQLGTEIVRFIDNSHEFKLISAVSSFRNVNIGKRLSDIMDGVRSNVILSNNLLESMSGVDVIVDCTISTALEENLFFYQQLKKPLLIATTAITEEVENCLYTCSHDFPICVCNNYSLLFNNLMTALNLGLSHFPKDLDVDIVETHSKKKKIFLVEQQSI